MKQHLLNYRKYLLLPAVFIAIGTVIFLLPTPATEPFIKDDYHYSLIYSKELEDIAVMKQKTAYTCGVASIAILDNYLGGKTTEVTLSQRLKLLDRRQGMLPTTYLSYANKALKPLGYSISLENPTSQTEIINSISSSLENHLPVTIFYATEDDWDKSHQNTHYAVIYGINMEKGQISLSNPYGYKEQITFNELFRSLEFTNYQEPPFTFRLGRKMGALHTNNLFILKKEF